MANIKGKNAKRLKKRNLDHSLGLSVQKEKALRLALRCGKVTANSLKDILQISRQATSRYLREMERGEEKLLLKRGEGRNTHYIIADVEAVKQHLQLSLEEKAMLEIYREWKCKEDEEDPWISLVQSEMQVKSYERPHFFFDVKNVIHPAFVANANFVITGYSDAFVEVFGRKPSHGETFVEFFKSLNNNIVGWKLDEEDDCQFKEGNFVESIVLPSLAERPGGKHPHVNKQLIRFNRAGVGCMYLEFSCAAQRAFPGLQSIMPIADKKVEDFRELKDLSSRWNFMLHHLLQPINNVAGVAGVIESVVEHDEDFFQLTTISRMIDEIRLTGGSCTNEVNDVLNQIDGKLRECNQGLRIKLFDWLHRLNRACAEFRRFVAEYSSAMQRLKANMGIPILSTLFRVVQDQDRSYAKEYGISIICNVAPKQSEAYIVYTDPWRLHGGLRSLVQNAIEACKHVEQQRKVVRVSHSINKGNGNLTIKIEDRGKGMSDKEISEKNKQARGKLPELGLGRVSGTMSAMKVAQELDGRLTYKKQTDGEGIIVEFMVNIKESPYEKKPFENLNS